MIALLLSPSPEAPISIGRIRLVSNVRCQPVSCTEPGSIPARSGAEHPEAMWAQHHEFLRQFEQAPQTARQTHVALRAGHPTKAIQAHIAALESSIFAMPGHLSDFDLFPDVDKVLHAIVDPMHAFLEGILPFYIRKVLILGRYCAVPPAGWAKDQDVASVCCMDSEGEGSADGYQLRDVYDEMVDRSGASEEPRAIERCNDMPLTCCLRARPMASPSD